MNTMAPMTAAATASTRPKAVSRRWSGVRVSVVSCSRPAIRPNSVAIPVATTTPVPRPYVTAVPLYAMFVRSPMDSVSSASAAVVLATGVDSPVNAASSILSAATSSSRRSAGTMVPTSRRTTSPGTSSAAGT